MISRLSARPEEKRSRRPDRGESSTRVRRCHLSAGRGTARELKTSKETVKGKIAFLKLNSVRTICVTRITSEGYRRRSWFLFFKENRKSRNRSRFAGQTSRWRSRRRLTNDVIKRAVTLSRLHQWSHCSAGTSDSISFQSFEYRILLLFAYAVCLLCATFFLFTFAIFPYCTRSVPLVCCSVLQ